METIQWRKLFVEIQYFFEFVEFKTIYAVKILMNWNVETKLVSDIYPQASFTQINEQKASNCHSIR